jgi:hypothetical protein
MAGGIDLDHASGGPAARLADAIRACTARSSAESASLTTTG